MAHLDALHARESLRQKLTPPSQALLHEHYVEDMRAVFFTPEFQEQYGACLRAVHARKDDVYTLQGMAAHETIARMQGAGQSTEGRTPLECVRLLAQYEEGVPLLAMIAPRVAPRPMEARPQDEA